MLHQDIKPSNLLVTADGQVQVVDFGLAATLASDRPLRRIAVSHGYAAPESLALDRPTMAVDVYSLGALLFELCAGQPNLRPCQRPRPSPWARRGAARSPAWSWLSPARS